jgi:pheromone a factor receptor
MLSCVIQHTSRLPTHAGVANRDRACLCGVLWYVTLTICKQPLILSITVVLTLRAFFVRRAEFSQFLCLNTSLTANRYFRLMALATTEIVLNTPLSIYFIYLNISDGSISPWEGWANAHYDYSAVDLIPYLEWHSSLPATLSLEFTRWSIVLCAFVFFAFFGFADEARKNYRLAFWTIAKRLGFRPEEKSMTGYAIFRPRVSKPGS